jgi:hypothetical protein
VVNFYSLHTQQLAYCNFNHAGITSPAALTQVYFTPAHLQHVPRQVGLLL